MGNTSGHPCYPTYQLREADPSKDCPQAAQAVQLGSFFSLRLLNIFKNDFFSNPGKIFLYNMTESDF